MKRILFDVPKWHVYQHRSARGLPLAEASDSARLKFEDELFERLYSGEPEPLTEKQRSPELREWAEKVHATCDALPEFGRLMNYCRGDAGAVGLGVEELMDKLGPQMTEPIEQLAAAALRRSVNAGCAGAATAIDQQREAMDALGGISWGTRKGTPGAATQLGLSRAVASRLRNDKRLARIAELAGRFKRIARAKQRSKVKHGQDEIADVELGADLSRLLPTELSRLSRPAQRKLFLRDLLERNCMQYRLSGAEPLGKGPLIVLLDKSGSMEGEKDIWSTAVSLALLEIAQRQRRIFALVSFESGVRDEQVVRPGDDLPEQALFTGCGGGTEIGAALRRGLKLVVENPSQLQKADVVLVTDGFAETAASSELRDKARGLGVTVLGVGIGVGSEALAPWCDQHVFIERLDTLDDRTAEQLFTL